MNWLSIVALRLLAAVLITFYALLSGAGLYMAGLESKAIGHMVACAILYWLVRPSPEGVAALLEFQEQRNKDRP